MLKLVNKNYSHYHVLKESQTLLAPSNWRKPRPKFDVTYAKFDEIPEDLDTLKDKEGTR